MQLRTLVPENMTFGDLVTFQGLGMVPLLSSSDPELPAVDFLTEALDRKLAVIREVTDKGEVSHLLVENSGERPVIILEGEELVGGKQNRIVNTTVLVPAGESLRIPVSCVEAHRWKYRHSDFGSSQALFRARSRATHKAGVSESLKYHKAFFSNQFAVWDEVGTTLRELGASSPTTDFQAGREKVADRIEGFVKAFQPARGQTGAAFVTHRGVLGCEWFATCDLYERAFRKIIRSFAFEALGAGEAGVVSCELLPPWWEGFVTARFMRNQSPGAGEDIRVESGDAIGSGLLWNQVLIHFSCLCKTI